MIRLIQFLVFGHWHKWATVKEVKYQEWMGKPGVGSPDKVATKYICRCEGCGKITSFIP